MTPKIFFTIVLKIFGLFFIKDIIVAIPPLFSTFFYLLREDSIMSGLSTLFFTLLVLLFYGVIAWYLLINTNKILDALKLENDFDEEEFPFNISQHSIYIIALIVIGGVILIQEIPNFCRILYSNFEIARLTHTQENNDLSLIIFSGIKIILGLLLIGERKRIVNIFHKEKETEEQE